MQQAPSPDLRPLLERLQKGGLFFSDYRLLRVALTAYGGEAVDPLLEVVRSGRCEGSLAQFLALAVLGDIGDKRATGPLLELLDGLASCQSEYEQHYRDHFRYYDLNSFAPTSLTSKIVDAIGQLRDSRAVPRLINLLLEGNNPFARSRAVAALRDIRDPLALRPLCEVAVSRTSDDYTRKELIEAIRELGDISAAVPILIEGLRAAKTDSARVSAMGVLTRLSEDAGVRASLAASLVEPIYDLLRTSRNREVLDNATNLLYYVFGWPEFDGSDWVRFLSYASGLRSAANGHFAEAVRAFEKARGTVAPGKAAFDRVSVAAKLLLPVVTGAENGKLNKKAVMLLCEARWNGNLGKDDEAIEQMTQAAMIEPTHAAFHFFLGELYSEVREGEKARAEYTRAVDIDPEYAAAHLNLCVEYYEMAELKPAIRHCDRAVKYGWPVPPQLLERLRPFRR